MQLNGKTILVTGGTDGIGRELIGQLRSKGAAIITQGRNADRVARTQADGFEVITADLSTAAGVEALLTGVAGRAVDILINNAGASWGAAAEDYPLEAWDKVFNLNIRGLFLLTQQIAKRSMIPRGSGRIINIASIAGLRGNPPGAMKTIAYTTSKGALINFTRTLAGEWGPYGITVNALAPGFFPTRMSKGLIESMGEEALKAHAPLQRFGDDEDLKGATLLFASDAGKHITGQILAVDGGVSAV